jgi:vacuolar iron transporter family protein
MKNSLLLKSLIYGGIDGIITIFNLIAGIEGAKLHVNYIIVICIAALISDGLSMGIGDYLSIKAHTKSNNIEDKSIKPNINAITTFGSFVLFGSVPLIIYIFINNIQKYRFLKMYIATLISLFVLGIIQSNYTNEKWYKSGIQVSSFGGITALLSYNISKYFAGIFL